MYAEALLGGFNAFANRRNQERNYELGAGTLAETVRNNKAKDDLALKLRQMIESGMGTRQQAGFKHDFGILGKQQSHADRMQQALFGHQVGMQGTELDWRDANREDTQGHESEMQDKRLTVQEAIENARINLGMRGQDIQRHGINTNAGIAHRGMDIQQEGIDYGRGQENTLSSVRMSLLDLAQNKERMDPQAWANELQAVMSNAGSLNSTGYDTFLRQNGGDASAMISNALASEGLDEETRAALMRMNSAFDGSDLGQFGSYPNGAGSLFGQGTAARPQYSPAMGMGPSAFLRGRTGR